MKTEGFIPIIMRFTDPEDLADYIKSMPPHWDFEANMREMIIAVMPASVRDVAAIELMGSAHKGHLIQR